MTEANGMERTAIGPWLLIPILLIATLSHGMLNNPRFIVKTMGNNAYWALLFSVCVVIAALAIIYLLAKRFPGQNIIAQGKSILGPYLGTITGLGYLGFYLLFLAFLIRDILNLTGVYFLNRTPGYVLALIYILAVAYLASRGITTITRTASLVVIPALLIIIILLGLAYQYINPNNLKPVFAFNLSDYLQAGQGSLQTYYMLGFAAMILPFLKPLNSFPRVAVGTTLLLFALFLLITIESIGVNGPKLILRLAYPDFEFFRVVNLPYTLLEQTGMLIGITWLTIILVATGFGHYTLALGTSQIFPFGDYQKWVWMLAPVELIICLLPPGVLETKVMVDLIAQHGWIPLFGYPFFLWIVALVFRKKGAAEDAAA